MKRADRGAHRSEWFLKDGQTRRRWTPKKDEWRKRIERQPIVSCCPVVMLPHKSETRNRNRDQARPPHCNMTGEV
jgi:hypothetical protein